VAEFKVPELGENVAGGDVTNVLVKVGDTIAVDQPVLELETDKATVEVPSSVAGRVTEIKVKPGDKVNVGALVLVVEDGNKAQDPGSKAQVATNAKEQSPHPAKPQDEDTRPDAPASRAAKSEAPKDKVVSMPAKGQGSTAKSQTATPRPQAQPAKAPGGYPAAPAAPSVRRLAREVGVNIDDVQGSGPEGRISDADVKEHARRILSSMPSLGAAAPASSGAIATRAAVPLPDFSRWGEVERQPMSNIRRTTSERLGHAWTTIPHVTQFDKADITAMEELRRKYREQVAAAGGNLTVTAMLVKVMATAVKQFPQFNASLDPQSSEIVYKKYVNVGVAVDTDRGLLVPVVRNADRKNITEIAIDVHQLAEKARGRKLTLDEMSGGGITISNLGGIGGTYFTPIVNWPEVAILGVSRGIVEPVWRSGPSTGSGEGTWEPRQLLPLSLSYDHRVIDGADAMRFLRWVAEAVEQPFLLSLLG
jgi:pyruvate dehydrogenase E2 component (dihydrolipoamide acetyltransferase)